MNKDLYIILYYILFVKYICAAFKSQTGGLE